MSQLMKSSKALKFLLLAGTISLPIQLHAAPNSSPLSPQAYPIFGSGKIVLMTLKGKLLKVANADGERTGWTLEIDGNVMFDGKKLERIDIDPLTNDVVEFENKRVQIKGRPSWMEGSPERGFFPIIELSTIQDMAS
jgi:hypothetical protein